MPTALAVLAHPDDAEFLCAGTLARLAGERGWAVHVATMTAGDCGSATHSAAEIAAIRKAEAAAAAAVIGGTYHCVGEPDLLVFYGERTLRALVALFRRVRPDVVFTHSPSDYHLDHEETSRTARAAAFAAPVPLFAPGAWPALDHVPHLYYCDPIDGTDPLGRPVPPGVFVDVSAVIDTKERMLAAHASQRDWLLKHHGMDEYTRAMRDWGAAQGRACGVAYAEGFRQHRGHGFPHDDRLAAELGARLPAPVADPPAPSADPPTPSSDSPQRKQGTPG